MVRRFPTFLRAIWRLLDGHAASLCTCIAVASCRRMHCLEDVALHHSQHKMPLPGNWMYSLPFMIYEEEGCLLAFIVDYHSTLPCVTMRFLKGGVFLCSAKGLSQPLGGNTKLSLPRTSRIAAVSLLFVRCQGSHDVKKNHQLGLLLCGREAFSMNGQEN